MPVAFRFLSDAIRGKADKLRARACNARCVLKGAKGAVLTSEGEAVAC